MGQETLTNKLRDDIAYGRAVIVAGTGVSVAAGSSGWIGAVPNVSQLLGA